jgi:hypothetical protein
VKIIIDILGWTGSILLLTAYGLNSYQKIKSDSLLYLMLNLISGLFLAIYAYYYTAFATTFINVVWVLIAIPALYKYVKSTKH